MYVESNRVESDKFKIKSNKEEYTMMFHSKLNKL